jgi:hypothetical protein
MITNYVDVSADVKIILSKFQLSDKTVIIDDIDVSADVSVLSYLNLGHPINLLPILSTFLSFLYISLLILISLFSLKNNEQIKKG